MKKRDREIKIYETALRLFSKYGYKKTTIDDVARELGMTSSNIYFYVKNKEDLYKKTVGNALEQWRDSISEAVRAGKNAEEKFHIMAEQSFAYLEEKSVIRGILERDSTIFSISSKEDRFYKVNLGARKIIAGILEQGIREGAFRRMNVNRAAEFIFSVYIMFLIKAYIKLESGSVKSIYKEGATIIFKGLCK